MSNEARAKEHLVEIDETSASQVLEAEIGQPITSLNWFKKGYYSRAALVEVKDGHKVVARFGIDPLGYQKDRYAAKHFASLRVPIPEIKTIKQLENNIWLCTSEYVEGVNSDELHGEQARAAIPSVQETLVALHSTQVDSTTGYGEFDENGRGSHSSWAAYLSDDFCSEEFYQDVAVDADLIKQAWAKIGELAKLCPTERFLVHEDFGSDNLLIKDGKVVAVLDWHSAVIGDWAMDVARCEKYPREVYGDLRAAHEQAGFDSSNWEARINCYRLRSQIGLVNWIWDRKIKGLKSWQDLKGAQNDLRSGLEQVKAGLVDGESS